MILVANLIETCNNLGPGDLEKMINDIATGSTTLAEGILMLLPKVRISPELTRKSSEFFIRTCQHGLKICSELIRIRNVVCINPRQCASFTEYTPLVAEYLREWQNLEHPHIWVCSSAVIDLVRCLENGLSLVDSCGESNWKGRALLGEITTELMCIVKDMNSLIEFTISILGTNKRDSFELASSVASEDLEHLVKHVLNKFNREPNDRLLGYLKLRYGMHGIKPVPIHVRDINYREYLGQGSYGAVQKVEWMGQVVALKTFAQKINLDDEQRVLSQVSHPNIVKVMGCTDKGMLMELLQTDLQRGGGGGSLVVVALLDIMYQVAKAMSYLHSNDIVHRDLKPANILLNSSLSSSWSPQFFAAKLADFGVSKKSFDTARSNTNMIGTLVYMAPEMLRGTDAHYTRKVDVYSFGATFMTILGAKLREGVLSRTLEERNHAYLKELDKCCPLFLKPLLRSCLDPNPDLRPSFPEVCNVLSFFRHQLIPYDDDIESDDNEQSELVETENESHNEQSESVETDRESVETEFHHTNYHNAQSEGVENMHHPTIENIEEMFHTMVSELGFERSRDLLMEMTTRVTTRVMNRDVQNVNGMNINQSDHINSCILHGTRELPFKLRDFHSIEEITLHVRRIDGNLQNMLSSVHVCNNQCKFLIKTIGFVLKCMDVWCRTGVDIQASSRLLEDLIILIYRVHILFAQCQRHAGCLLKAAVDDENRVTFCAIHKDICKCVRLINSLVPESDTDEWRNLESSLQQQEPEMQELNRAAELDGKDLLQTLRNASVGRAPDSKLAAFCYKIVQHKDVADSFVKESFIHPRELRIEEVLGQGGNGTVFKTEWLQQRFALKAFSGVEDEVFKRELSALACARHPNIVRLFGHSKLENGDSGLIMELMDVDLSKLIEGRRLSQKVALHIILQVAKAMAFLHDNNVIHRDLKPHNIMLSLDCLRANCEEGPVDELILAKVADFGLAKTKFESARASNTSGRGTHNYMSPEIYDSKQYTKRTDVFSYGMTCYHILTGEKPFAEILKQIQQHEDDKLRAFFTDLRNGLRPPLNSVPEMFHSMLNRCWDPIAAQRPSFQEICQSLEDLQNKVISVSN